MAQQVVGARAGTISFTTGAVFVDGQPARATPVKFPSLNEGQVLGTDRGRAEVLLAPEVFLRLGSQSAMRLVRAPRRTACSENNSWRFCVLGLGVTRS